MKFIKGLLFSIASLIVGFLAISLPLGLLGNLSTSALHIVFFMEITVYFITAMIFLIIIENKLKNKRKAERRQAERCEKCRKVQEEWLNLAA